MTVTVASVVVARAGFINWIQGTGTTYTVAVDAQTDYITVTDTGDATAALTAHVAAGDPHTGYQLETAVQTQVTFSVAGALAASTVGVFRWYNTSGRTLTFASAVLAVSVAPVTSAVVCDVNVNGTTCFVASSQANRPSIAAAGFTGSTTTFDSIATITNGQYITVDVDTVGTGTTGSNLTVTIWMTG